MIGEAEKDIAGPAAIEFGLKLRGRRGLEQIRETAPRFGGRGEPRRSGEAVSERCGHSGPARRAQTTAAAQPPRAR